LNGYPRNNITYLRSSKMIGRAISQTPCILCWKCHLCGQVKGHAFAAEDIFIFT